MFHDRCRSLTAAVFSRVSYVHKSKGLFMRPLLALCTLCAFSLAIVGCGGESEPSAANNGVAPQAPDNIPKAPGKPTGKAVD